MTSSEFNLSPIITIADRYQLRLPSDKRFADIQEDFAFPSICPKEKLARKIYSYLTALYQLSHIDNVPARCMMLTIPLLRTREQRDFIATILNQPIFLNDGSINVHSATVSVSLKSVVLFIEFRGVEALDTFLGGLVIQIVNDSIQAIISKFTSYTVDETQDNVLGIVGSIGNFDGSSMGIQTYQIIYDMSQVITLIYLDKARYKTKTDFMLIAMHLVQNSFNRYIMFRGKPCSYICVAESQIISMKYGDLFDALERWERCLSYLICKSAEDLTQEGIQNTTIEDRIVTPEQKHGKNDSVDIYLLARRGTKYQFDAAADLKRRISKLTAFNVYILENTPSCPQDLVVFQLHINNMSTYSCVKSIESILKEQGSYQIEIDLASGIVQYLNTEQSIHQIMQSINDAGFGATQVLKSEYTDLVNQLDAASSNLYYTKFWTARMLINSLFFAIMNIAKLASPLSYQITLTNNVVSVLLSLINYPILTSGAIAAVRSRRWLPESSFALIIVFQLAFNIATFSLVLSHLGNDGFLREAAAIDVSNGMTAVLCIVCLARMIESYGKKNAIKQFQGLAETLPSDIQVVKDLKLDKLVEQFGEDHQTVEFLQSSQRCAVNQEPIYKAPECAEAPMIPDCIPRSDSCSIAYTDILKSTTELDDLNSLINSDVLQKILTTLSLKHCSFDIDSYNNNELAQQHKIQTVKLASLQPGQVVLVYPGEIIPCDGYILYGHSPIDEGIVSMRHHGIAKGPGDKVYAGTRVLNSDIFVCACAVGQETLLGYLISSVRRSTTAANTTVAQRDDLQTTLIHGKRSSGQLINNIMFWYRPVVLGLSVVATALVALDFFVFGNIAADSLFLIRLQHPVTVLYGKLTALLTVFSCLQMAAQPFAYQLCLPLCSLVGTDRFAKQSIIVRDCAKVCQKLSYVKAVAFPRSGGITYGKPLITDLNMYIDLHYLVEELPTEYEFQGDGSALFKYNSRLFKSKEEIAAYLYNFENFNYVLSECGTFKQLLINQCVTLLQYISALMIAQQNSIQAGVFTTIRTLQEQKYTKYFSKPSSVMKQSIPVISSFQYDSEQNIIEGEVIYDQYKTNLKIKSTFQEPEYSKDGRICVYFSHLVDSAIQIMALGFVPEDLDKDDDHFHLLIDDVHRIEFVISDKLRDEAPSVIRELYRMNYQTFLTSTDSPDSCYISAKQAGIPDTCVFPNLHFDEKPHLLTKLAAKHGKILYVCDGVNDLKCIQSVHVSLAVSDGRDGIKAASDFVSLKCTLSDVVKCLKMAKGIRAYLLTSQLIAGVLTVLLIPFSSGVLLPAKIQVYVQYIALLIATIGIIVLIVCLSFLKKLADQINADDALIRRSADSQPQNQDDVDVASLEQP